MNKVFLGRQLESLSNLIAEQCKPVFEEFEIVVPVKSCSVLLMIRTLGDASVADISKQTNSSHQLVNQKIPALLKLKIVECHSDVNDKRRKNYRVTKKGFEQCKKIDAVSELFTKAYEHLYVEIGKDLLELCIQAEQKLTSTPIVERIKNPEN